MVYFQSYLSIDAKHNDGLKGGSFKHEHIRWGLKFNWKHNGLFLSNTRECRVGRKVIQPLFSSKRLGLVEGGPEVGEGNVKKPVSYEAMKNV